MSDLTEVIRAYLEIWNEPDADARSTAIARIFADEGTYTDPLAAVQGYHQIAGLITAVRDQFPGHSFTLAGSVDTHHNLARFGWDLTPIDGDEPLVVGFDVVVADQDGRLREVHGFLDKVPAA